MARTAVHGKQRNRHRNKYWRKYDKQNYVCPNCGRGIEEVKWFEVHHKDGDPTNGDMDNLVGLCRDCHYEVHNRDPPGSLDDWKQSVEFI